MRISRQQVLRSEGLELNCRSFHDFHSFTRGRANHASRSVTRQCVTLPSGSMTAHERLPSSFKRSATSRAAKLGKVVSTISSTLFSNVTRNCTRHPFPQNHELRTSHPSKVRSVNDKTNHHEGQQTCNQSCQHVRAYRKNDLS